MKKKPKRNFLKNVYFNLFSVVKKNYKINNLTFKPKKLEQKNFWRKTMHLKKVELGKKQI